MAFKKHFINLIMSMVLATIYAHHTPYDVRGYDADAHVEFIQSIANQKAIPPLKDSWESYHPPLYHLSALALDLLLGGTLNYMDFQRLALAFFFLTTMVAGVFFLRYPNLPFLASFFFALIPGYLFFAARINNDVMLPFMGALAYVGILSYWEKPDGRKAFFLGILVALAMAVKLNAFAIWVALGFCLLLGPAKRRPWPTSGRQLLEITLAMLPGALFLGGWMLRSYLETGLLFYSNAPYLTPTLTVSTTAYKFLGFDFKAFLSQPSAEPFGGQIRDSFWSYLFTTYLVGEFSFSPSWTPLITWMRVAFLLVIACLALGISKWRQNWHDSLFRAGFIFSLLQLLFVAAIAVKQPFSCSMDARYLAPAFLPIAVLIGFGWQQAHDRGGLWGHVAKLAQVAFPALIGVFYAVLFVSIAV